MRLRLPNAAVLRLTAPPNRKAVLSAARTVGKGKGEAKGSVLVKVALKDDYKGE